MKLLHDSLHLIVEITVQLEDMISSYGMSMFSLCAPIMALGLHAVAMSVIYVDVIPVYMY